MGLNLYGYMFCGPLRFTDEQIAAAQDRLAALTRIHATPKEDRTTADATTWDRLEARIEEYAGPCDEADIAAVADGIIRHVPKILEECQKTWACDYRDVATRDVTIGGQTTRIVFTGEATWGDGPSGRGYKAMQTAMITGIDEDLGIQ